MEWIKIEPNCDMPVPDINVLVYDGQEVFDAVCDSDGIFYRDGFDLEPTHWMHMPQPPQTNK